MQVTNQMRELQIDIVPIPLVFLLNFIPLVQGFPTFFVPRTGRNIKKHSRTGWQFMSTLI